LVGAANAARRQASQAAAGIVVTIATLAASAWLVRGDSLVGAALATVVSAGAGLLAFGIIFLTIGKGPATERAHADDEFRGTL
jgi:hypothetical protein